MMMMIMMMVMMMIIIIIINYIYGGLHRTVIIAKPKIDNIERVVTDATIILKKIRKIETH